MRQKRFRKLLRTSETELVIETEAVETEQVETEAVTETETVIETEAAEETETESVSETETEAETEVEAETEAETEPETENIVETETEAETETESDEEELVNRNLRVRTDEGALVSVSGLMPADVKAQALDEDAAAYSEDLEGDGLLAVDISLPRESGSGSEAVSVENADTGENAQGDADAGEIKEDYQPEEPVRVIITDPAIGEAVRNHQELEVYHVADDGTSTKVEGVRFVGNSALFYADGFSVYVVTYTVDFHWGEYTYSIEGESEILLSALFEKLGIDDVTLSDVTDVSFSNPELVKVEKTDTGENADEQAGYDWLLTSLAPFDTEEALTLVLRNGQVVEIKVTDETDFTGWNEFTIHANAIAAGDDNKLFWKVENGCLYIHSDADIKENRDIITGGGYSNNYGSQHQLWKDDEGTITSAVVSGGMSAFLPTCSDI